MLLFVFCALFTVIMSQVQISAVYTERESQELVPLTNEAPTSLKSKLLEPLKPQKPQALGPRFETSNQGIQADDPDPGQGAWLTGTGGFFGRYCLGPQGLKM